LSPAVAIQLKTKIVGALAQKNTGGTV